MLLDATAGFYGCYECAGQFSSRIYRIVWVGGWVWVSWYTPFILYYLPLIGFALIFYFAEDGVVQQNGAYLMVSGFFIYMAVIFVPIRNAEKVNSTRRLSQ